MAWAVQFDRAMEGADETLRLLGVFAVVLSCIFFVLLLVAVAQLVRIFHHRHSKGSFQFMYARLAGFTKPPCSFLVLCVVWMSMRLTLLVVVLAMGGNDKVPLPLTLMFVWLPFNVEFATYTLLVVFYCQVRNAGITRADNAD